MQKYFPIYNGTSLILYTDNCPGQNKNKNKTMAAYLRYLVNVIKRFPCVEHHFLISSDTKFSPDRNFGHIKTRVSQEIATVSLILLVRTALLRIQGERTMSLLIKNRTPLSIERLKKFLSNQFLPCNDIRNWDKIKIFPENDEVCIANYEKEELKTIKILKTNANLAGFPD